MALLQIVSSAHYMLSDIYIPQDVDPQSPNFYDEESESESGSPELSDGEDEREALDDKSSYVTHVHSSPGIKVSSLCLPYKSKPEPKFR